MIQGRCSRLRAGARRAIVLLAIVTTGAVVATPAPGEEHPGPSASPYSRSHPKQERLTMTVFRTVGLRSRRQLDRYGYRVLARCGSACLLRAEVRVSKPGARRLGVRSRLIARGEKVLGMHSGGGLLRLRLTREARRALRVYAGGFVARMTVRARHHPFDGSDWVNPQPTPPLPPSLPRAEGRAHVTIYPVSQPKSWRKLMTEGLSMRLGCDLECSVSAAALLRPKGFLRIGWTTMAISHAVIEGGSVEVVRLPIIRRSLLRSLVPTRPRGLPLRLFVHARTGGHGSGGPATASYEVHPEARIHLRISRTYPVTRPIG